MLLYTPPVSDSTTSRIWGRHPHSSPACPGTFTWANGSWYTGEFSLDTIHGFGEYRPQMKGQMKTKS